MFAVPPQYICLLAGLEYVSLLALEIRDHRVLERLLIDHAIIVWLLASIWISLFLLRRCQSTKPIQCATTTSSNLLPLHGPVHHEPGRQKAEDVTTALSHFVVLIAFAHAWLTFLHLFTVIVSDRTISCQSQGISDNPVSIAWATIALVAFASSLLVLVFGHCLLAFGIKKDFEHWGYFLYLFRIISFLFSTWSLLLWIIDLFEGRIEILRT
ncbi:hypothetical protein D9757_005560 [Collybiopsis confluens]|uniref:Transmembrane protein n=1 Tax=Collybiopsis confluens TaxID=2823264 RepID=A0A8H5M8W9_9AGAR|nr:hypothetical protein D9757_005560 [Collybiopsis confluens]